MWKKGNTRDALMTFQRAQEFDPDDMAALTHLGVALAHEGDTDGAVSVFERAVAMSSQPGNLFAHIARAKLQGGDVDGAITAFHKSIEADPSHADVRSDLGAALHYHRGDLNDARINYEQALAIDPLLPYTLSNLGHVLQAQGDLDGAVKAYRRVLAIDNRMSHAYADLANALISKKQYAEASAVYKQAEKVDPQQARRATDRMYTLMQYFDGNQKKAIAAYHTSLVTDPRKAHHHLATGHALLDTGHTHEALAEFKNALVLDPDMHHT